MADEVTQLQNALDNDPFDGATNEPLPAFDSIGAMVGTSHELATAFGSLMDTIDAQTTQRRATLIAQGTAAVRELKSGHVDAAGMTDGDAFAAVTKAAELKAKEAASRFRAELLTANNAQIGEMTKRLAAAEKQLAAVMKTYPSPVNLLAAQRLDDPKRAVYTQNLAKAGKNELQMHARLAIQNGDRALGAAVLTRLHELPASDRPFTPLALAKQIVGAEHDGYATAHRQLATMHQTMQSRLRAVSLGKSDPLGKVSEALRKRGLPEVEVATKKQEQRVVWEPPKHDHVYRGKPIEFK
jgi:hypothetical protein